MASDDKSERYRQGAATRRAVLGDAHVDRSERNRTEFDAPFQELITEAAWGHVWSRPALTKRERSMITLAILAALGREDELVLHARATANTGASEEDVREVLMHVAIYAGVPAANTAYRIVKEVFADLKNAGSQDSSKGET